MKRSLYLLAGVLAASLMGSSCGNSAQKKAAAESEEQALFVCMDTTMMERDGVKLT